jgi:hypothetical protein
MFWLVELTCSRRFRMKKSNFWGGNGGVRKNRPSRRAEKGAGVSLVGRMVEQTEYAAPLVAACKWWPFARWPSASGDRL